MSKDKHHQTDENKKTWGKEAPKKDWGKVAEATADAPHAETKAAEAASTTNETTAEAKTAAHQESIEHPDYTGLENKLTATEVELNKVRSDWLRMQAEMANILRRSERDVANAHKYGMEKFALELLPIIDNLERSLEVQIPEANDAIKNLYTGIELTLKMFLAVLKKFAIDQLNPVGEAFNPTYHTAMTVQEKPGVKPNTVLQVLQKGYLLKDRLLRPAAVIVSK
jgi:molecular chaperone GrpE